MLSLRNILQYDAFFKEHTTVRCFLVFLMCFFNDNFSHLENMLERSPSQKKLLLGSPAYIEELLLEESFIQKLKGHKTVFYCI